VAEYEHALNERERQDQEKAADIRRRQIRLGHVLPSEEEQAQPEARAEPEAESPAPAPASEETSGES
jgi:hypothetical protein